MAAELGAGAIVQLRLEVVEPGATDEDAEVSPCQREVGAQPDLVGDESLFVVQVAVVRVHRRRVAAVRDADEVEVGALGSEHHTVGESDIQDAVDGAGAEDLGLGAPGRQPQDERSVEQCDKCALAAGEHAGGPRR